MDIISVDSENITDYSEVLPANVAENLERSCYHAIGSGSGGSILVWKDAGRDEKVKKTVNAMILWFRAEDREMAKQLLEEYEKRIKEAGMKESLLRLPADTEEAVKSALVKQGFQVKLGEGSTLILTLKDMVNIELLKGIPLSSHIADIGNLELLQLRKGLDICSFYHGDDMPEDLMQLPVQWFDRKLSCYIEMDGEAGGFLLVHRMPSGGLLPQLFRVIKPASGQALLEMLKYVITKASETYSLDTQVYIPCANQSVRAFMEKLLPDKKCEREFIGSIQI